MEDIFYKIISKNFVKHVLKKFCLIYEIYLLEDNFKEIHITCFKKNSFNL